MVALAAALLAVLAAGLWLGGHPANLPSPLRDVFVDESAGLTAEATELIEDNYYRKVDESELINSSLSGMARGLRRRFHDRFSEYFPPEVLERFNEAIEGRFSGIGLTVDQGQARAAGRKGLQGLARRKGGDRAGRRDRHGRRARHLRPQLDQIDRTDQGAGRNRRRDRRARRHGSGRRRGPDPDPGPDLGPGRRQHGARNRTAGSSATCAWPASAKARTPTCGGRSNGSGARARKG